MVQRRSLLATTAFGLAMPGLARAQGFPNRPIRLVVAYAAGGGTDVVARTIAKALSTELGQTVLVDNRPGAGGNLATEQVASAPADGHTLLVGNQGPMAVNPHLFANMRVDPANGLEAVGLIADAPLLLVTASSGPLDTVPKVIARLRAGKGEATYASAGNGSASHLAAALFVQQAGAEATHLPFRGAGPALTDVVAGRIDFMVTTIPSVVGLVESGLARGLAVTTLERSARLPTIPTLAETALPGFSTGAWYGIMAPKGTPAAVRATLEAALDRALAQQAVADVLKMEGAAPSTLRGQGFATFIAAERKRWADVVRAAKITVD